MRSPFLGAQKALGAPFAQRRALAFHPSEIPGLLVWWDFKDSSTLFQDGQGAILAALGDPVGLVRDKSGNGYDLSQPTVSAAPTRIVDGLDFDGLDDEMLYSTVSTSEVHVCFSNAAASPPAPLFGLVDDYLHIAGPSSVSVDGVTHKTGGVAVNGQSYVPAALDGTNIDLDQANLFSSARQVLSFKSSSGQFWKLDSLASLRGSRYRYNSAIHLHSVVMFGSGYSAGPHTARLVRFMLGET